MTTAEHEPSRAPGRAALGAVIDGWARMRGQWRAIGVAWLLGLALALPLAAALRMGLRQSLAHREAAERMLAGWDGLWHRSFSAQAEGLETTFDAGVVGIGAVLRSLDALVTGSLFDLPLPLVVAGLVYLMGWVLLGGGLLARFRGDPRGVVTLGVIHFWRLLTIAAVGWLAWALLLGGCLAMLGEWARAHSRDVIDERVIAISIVGKYALVWIAVLAIRLVIDHAKVIAVDDSSRSPWSALREALRFCRRRAIAVLGVAAILGAVGLVLLAAYGPVAPDGTQSDGFGLFVAFATGQVYVIARVVMRAWALASAQALWSRERSRAPAMLDDAPRS
jgi:hypothetical protein